MTCTFVTGSGRKLYYPNTKLLAEPIINVSRSDNFWDSVQILLDLATPGSLLESAESRWAPGVSLLRAPSLGACAASAT